MSRRRSCFHLLIWLHFIHVTFLNLSRSQSLGKGGSWLGFYSEGNDGAEARAANLDSSKILPISWLVSPAAHTQLQGWRSFQAGEKLLCAKAYWKYRKTSQYEWLVTAWNDFCSGDCSTAFVSSICGLLCN